MPNGARVPCGSPVSCQPPASKPHVRSASKTLHAKLPTRFAGSSLGWQNSNADSHPIHTVVIETSGGFGRGDRLHPLLDTRLKDLDDDLS